MSTTLTPFLYQTRTLQRAQAVIAVRGPLSRAFFHAPTSLRKRTRPVDNSIPFELPHGLELTKDESGRALEGEFEPEKTSTITPTERRAFDAIFQEIASGSAHSSRAQVADNVINLVVQDAMGKSRKLSPPHSSVIDRDAALEKFPASLRKAASLALGAMENPDDMIPYEGLEGRDVSRSSGDSASANNQGEGDVLDWENNSISIDQLVKTATIGEHRRREQHRVEKGMASAESDLELWGSLAKNVFRMVDRLGIGEKTARQHEAPPTQTSDGDIAKRKKKELNIYVHGPLYPLLLLRGLRLLDKAFEKPSALALSVLPRMKELGLASFVLGASTPFYNTLMGIYWYRYGDVGAVFNLLEEMRRAGLSFDEDSLEIIRDMDKTLVPYAEGENGQFVKELTAMPEYEAAFDSRLPHWETIIQSAIDDKKRPAIY